METITFPGFESFVPSNYYNSLDLRFGAWVMRLFDISISSKQPEKLMDQLFGVNDETIHPELVKMNDELRMETRATSAPEVFIYTNVLDNYQRLISVNSLTVEDIAAYLVRRSLKDTRDPTVRVNYHKMLPLADAFIRIPSSMGLAYSIIDHTRVMMSVKTQLQLVVDMPRSVSTLSSTIEGSY